MATGRRKPVGQSRKKISKKESEKQARVARSAEEALRSFLEQVRDLGDSHGFIPKALSVRANKDGSIDGQVNLKGHWNRDPRMMAIDLFSPIEGGIDLPRIAIGSVKIGWRIRFGPGRGGDVSDITGYPRRGNLPAIVLYKRVADNYGGAQLALVDALSNVVDRGYRIIDVAPQIRWEPPGFKGTNIESPRREKAKAERRKEKKARKR